MFTTVLPCNCSHPTFLMRFFNPPGTKILIVTPDCEFIHYLCHGSQLEMLTRSRSRLRRSLFLLFSHPPPSGISQHTLTQLPRHQAQMQPISHSLCLAWWRNPRSLLFSKLFFILSKTDRDRHGEMRKRNYRDVSQMRNTQKHCPVNFTMEPGGLNTLLPRS